MITIGEILRVSPASRSKAAGRLVEVAGLRTNGMGRVKEVKVRIIPSFGRQDTQYAYVSPKFLEKHIRVKFASVEEVESRDGYVCESTEPNVQFKWALCKGVEFITDKEFDYIDEYGYPSKTDIMCGFISDQWVEDGEKLYNIVFLGDFRVVKESEITRYVSPRKA
ncbi:modifier of transcription [Escherichia phage PNJ-6]|nr:modifier of transcription [Escherichia phage PNJ-6]